MPKWTKEMRDKAAATRAANKAAQQNGAAPKANGTAGRRRRRTAPQVGRFSCCSLGVVTVWEEDMKHGVTLEAPLALELRDFLNRMLPVARGGDA